MIFILMFLSFFLGGFAMWLFFRNRTTLNPLILRGKDARRFEQNMDEAERRSMANNPDLHVSHMGTHEDKEYQAMRKFRSKVRELMANEILMIKSSIDKRSLVPKEDKQ